MVVKTGLLFFCLPRCTITKDNGDQDTAFVTN